MSELLGKGAVDGPELLGNEINEVTDQLREADSFHKMKMTVENFLLKHLDRLKQILPIDRVLPLLTNAGNFSRETQVLNKKMGFL